MFAGQEDKSETYFAAYSARARAFDKIFWVEEKGIWLDYDIEAGSNRDEFYPSNIMPLWADCVDVTSDRKMEIEEKVLNYLEVMLYMIHQQVLVLVDEI